MIANFTTDNIDNLRAVPSDAPGRWKLTFRSGNDGLCHQLYVNGRLTDWTDTTEQRDFLVESPDGPPEVLIAAVHSEDRTVGFEQLLAPTTSSPDWTYRGSVVRSSAHCSRSSVQLFTDRATGQMDPSPRLTREIWPDWAPRWTWGEDLFGQGGFGYDGKAAPGFGKGSSGAGLFGIDTDVIALEAALLEEGTHQVLLRTVTPEGNHADADIQTVASAPPPIPPTSLTVTQYDPQTQILTIEIE